MKFRFLRAVFFDAILFFIFTFCIFNTSLVVYALRMAKGELHIVWNARPIDEVVKDNHVADSVKAKLKLILEIRQFAFDSIGLKRTDNYTTFFDQHNQPLIYVVTACKPFALQPHLWHFPFLGDVPYKGFFDAGKAKTEEEKFRAMGWDADISGAGGWSTLGWFKDPVLSQMLDYSDGDLAETIIHELTHGTIFVKDSVDYNENLASFIGYKGALQFLEMKFGKNSPQYLGYINGRKDEKTKSDFMLACAHSLDSLYKNFPAGCDSACKLKLKHDAFAKFSIAAKTLPLAGDSTFYIRFEMRMQKSGNAFFMHYVRYESKQTDFENEFERFGNLRDYMTWLKKKYRK